jgi:hypothetical protein
MHFENGLHVLQSVCKKGGIIKIHSDLGSTVRVWSGVQVELSKSTRSGEWHINFVSCLGDVASCSLGARGCVL